LFGTAGKGMMSGMPIHWATNTETIWAICALLMPNLCALLMPNLCLSKYEGSCSMQHDFDLVACCPTRRVANKEPFK
jgi:hypothetical protein